MDKGQLRELIQLVLEEYGLYSRDAEEILMLTCAAESNMGQYIKQVGGGPALGIFQCEPNTLNWAWNKACDMRDKIELSVEWDRLVEDMPPMTLKKQKDWVYKSNKFLNKLRYKDIENDFIFCLSYQIIMCRLVYYFKTSKALPSYKDVQGMAEYYKKYYNSILGAATVEGTIKKYNKYVKV